MRPERVRRFVWMLSTCAALGLGVGAAQPSFDEARPYRVECADDEPCRADLAIYIGWRVFQAQCATCHAADARGSSFAPDLTLRMSRMARRDFFTALDRGYFGSESAMPPRGRDPNVAPYYDELWSFLRARISGDLPAGPVMPEKGTDLFSPVPEKGTDLFSPENRSVPFSGVP